MAVNRPTYIASMSGESGPYTRLGKFQAGSTQAIKMGEILELSGGYWIPLSADKSMAAIIAVAAVEIKSGTRAGYFPIIIPRPDDIFEFELAAAGATAEGTALYYSTSQIVTVTVGSNALGTAVGQENYPDEQGHLASGDIVDAGTTVRSQNYVRMTFIKAASYYAALVK